MRTIGIAAALALAVGTGTADAQPMQTGAAPSISARDKAVGAEANPKLLDEYGGRLEGRQAAYVEQVGRRIAVQSGLADTEGAFTVALLNSSVYNAFAIPGGYVYVTRQLLALMNDEAELAGVLGHEVGHVAARHSAKREAAAKRNSIFGTMAQLAAGMFLGGGVLGSVANQGIGTGTQLLTLGYSRGQETQADDLGVRYLAGAGYDPAAMAGALALLQAETDLEAGLKGQGGKATPSWASTHPDPGARVTRALAQAQATRRSGGVRNRDAFLAAIDGMIVDDDPREGIIDGRTFRHPYLKVRFTAPEGFALTNGSQAVMIAGSGGQAQFSGGALTGTMESYVAGVFRKLDANASVGAEQVKRVRLAGFDAAVATLHARAGDGQADVTVVAYQTAPAAAFHFLTITPAGSGLGRFAPMIDSFARLTDAEAAAIVRPRRLKVVTVAPGDTVASLGAQMAYPDRREERFRVLNALGSVGTVAPGGKVKLVVLGEP